MDTNKARSGGATTRIAVAAGVAGLGLAVGGIAIATAGDGAVSTAAPGIGFLDLGDRGDRGFGDHGRFGDELAARLAEALGVEQAEVETALEDLREDLDFERPDLDDSELPTPPTEEELQARQAEVAAALAEALGLEQAEVEAALEEIRAEAEAEAEERFADLREGLRPALVERLDEAVADGSLTEADKESVLKAYDAGILGIGSGGFGPGGPFGHGPFGHGGFGGLDDSDASDGSAENSSTLS